MHFERPITLSNGLRVRLRLPHRADRSGVRALHERAGMPIDDLAPGVTSALFGALREQANRAA